MDVITIESEAFQLLEQKIDKIAGFVAKIEATPNNKEPTFIGVKLETEQICDILDISTRTLLRIRKEGRLFYYIEKGKCIYKFEDIEQLIRDKILPTHIKSVEEFHKAYLGYVK